VTRPYGRGGTKEKGRAAHRADRIDVPAEARRDLEIRFVREVEAALELVVEGRWWSCTHGGPTSKRWFSLAFRDRRRYKKEPGPRA